MSDIIAGDPADTKPAARSRLFLALRDSLWLSTRDALLDAYRDEVLAEAIEAAQSKRLANALFGSDVAYNHGIADALVAISSLTEAGESRG